MTQPDILSRLQARDQSTPVVIWGAGRAGVHAVRYLRDHAIEPIGFVDSNPRVSRLEGLPVHRPDRLVSPRDQPQAPFVVIASQHAPEIARQAKTLGLTADDFDILDPAAVRFTDPVEPNFYHLLHELRGHALSDMPRGARTMLSAGCGGSWYFDWIAKRYGPLERHIGTEAYRQRPEQLPTNVTWLERDVIHVPEVEDNAIDLVFSGQNVEHLWPAQMAGFLLESHRVLAPGGWLVVDSPNREITRRLLWTHPEHTIEYSVDDIRGLLDLAGFGDIQIRGIWLCQDGDRLLDLSPFEDGKADSMEVMRRALLARTRPESSFVWWAEARKTHAPRRDALIAELDRLFARHWPERLSRFMVRTPTRVEGDVQWARIQPAGRELVARGPMFPLPAGRSSLRFVVRGEDDAMPCRLRIDLTRGPEAQEPFVSRTVTCGAAETTVELDVSLTDEITFHLQTHLVNAGGGGGEVRLTCEHQRVAIA